MTVGDRLVTLQGCSGRTNAGKARKSKVSGAAGASRGLCCTDCTLGGNANPMMQAAMVPTVKQMGTDELGDLIYR